MNFHALKDIINPKRVIDIGANIGEFTSSLSSICPDVDITMIEANPNCKGKLSEIGYPFSILTLSNKKKEKVKFFINKDDDVCTGSSLYKQNRLYLDIDWREIEVDTYLLDDLNIYPEGIDLIKMDVQGSEKDIIEGSVNTLKRTNYLLLECSFANYNIGAPQTEEVISSVEKFGFYPLKILSEHWSRIGIDVTPVSVVQQIDVLFSKIKNNLCQEKIAQYRKKYNDVI